MRAHRVMVVVAVLILGLGAWQFFSPTKIAAVVNNDLDVLKMQRDLKDLPAYNLHDFTLVFDAD